MIALTLAGRTKTEVAIGYSPREHAMPDVLHSPPRRRPLLARSLLASLTGGVIAWVLVFAGRWWGLIVGLAATLALIAVSSRSRRAEEARLMFLFSPACIVITWPVILFPAALVRYWITGKSLGS